MAIRPPAVTFVLHDAGETKAMQPVMQNLDNQGIPYSILAEATAKKLLENDPHLVPSSGDVVQLAKNNPAIATMAQARLQNAMQAPCTVTGLVSDFQKQWAGFFKASGKRVVGYYDAFSFDRFTNRAETFKGLLTHLITPTLDSARFFQQRFGNIPVVALGQPSLEESTRTIRQVNRPVFAQQLGIDLNQPTLLFVGSYGPGYPEAFSLFLETIRRFPYTNVLLSLHPKSDGQYEQAMLQQAGLQDRVRIVPRGISTMETLAVTDVVLAHQSTVSTQALLQGKQVIQLGSVPQSDFDPIQQYQVAPRCETSAHLAQALAQAIPEARSARTVPPDEHRINMLYQLFGLPRQASQRITQFLLLLAGQQNAKNPSLAA
ncbi:MAG TPA: hypothetical protein V6C52_11160 [Coleofasciculaceae cyanobacterium]